MPWSNIHDHNNSQAEKKEGENLTVTEFKPRIFTLKQSDSNDLYFEKKKLGSDFIMSDVVKKITGIEDIEKKNEQDIIDRRVNEQLEILKKQTYDESYQVGLKDGFKAAADQRLQEINKAIDDFQTLVSSIQKIKSDLVHQNEAHIVSAIFHISRKIAYAHIEENPDLVLPVIKQTVEIAQSDEEVTVLVSPEQIDFIENLKNLSNRDFDFLKNIRLEPSESIAPGGCIVETNYGVIDAQIETRINKIWEELKQALPKVKKIAG